MSKYVMGAVNLTEIARMPSGSERVLMLNPEERRARDEVSKQLKSVFTKAGRQCALKSREAMLKMDDGSWRETHLLYIQAL